MSRFKPWLGANRPRTASYTLGRLKRCFDRWHLWKLSEITTELVEDWKVDRFREGCTPSTVLRDIATLSAVLTRAVKMGKLQDNPVRRVDKPKIDRRPQVCYLDTDEEARLRRALIHRDQKAQKNAKVGKSLATQASQGRIADLELLCRSSNSRGHTRHVPLNDEPLETLQRWRKQNLHHERVFPITTSFKTA